MTRLIITILLPLLLNACASSSGMLNPTPPVNSPETSANITIHRAISQDALPDNLIFTINGVDTFGFDKDNDFKFVLNEGNYIFGYKHGVFEKHCSVDVEIHAGINYVFSLEPDCVIELE
ncbi:MAG: hypothetical protein KAI44_10550 [Methylococcales bacterium]|nr:hypothetical protein [Methylococcales bacterium]